MTSRKRRVRDDRLIASGKKPKPSVRLKLERRKAQTTPKRSLFSRVGEWLRSFLGSFDDQARVGDKHFKTQLSKERKK